jgi:hypothetical protein
VNYTFDSQSELSKRLTFPAQQGPGIYVIVGYIAAVLLYVGASNVIAGTDGSSSRRAYIILTVSSIALLGLLAMVLVPDVRKYRRMEARWKKAYYCHRCGSVFLPGESRFVPASRMKELLV